MKISDQPGAKCRRCGKISRDIYCRSCRLKIIRKRLDSSLPGKELPMEAVVGDFIEQMAQGKKPKARAGKSRYEMLTASQLEEYLGKKIRLGDAAKLVQTLEKENPGSANAFYNAIKKYKNTSSR